MKILEINTFENGGGAAKFFCDINKWLNNKGIGVWKYVKKTRKTSTNTLSAKRNILSILFSRLISSEFVLSNQFNRIKANLNWKDTDVIHIHNPHGRFLGFTDLYKIFKSKKCVWTLHDPWIVQSKRKNVPEYTSIFKNNSLIDSLFIKWTISKNDPIIVCPTDWLKKKVQTSFPNKKIFVINNCIDTKIFKPENKSAARIKLSLPIDKLIVLFVANGGVKNTQKGGHYFNNIKEKYPNYHFLELGDKLTINSEEEMSLYYSAADVLLFPSLAENMPLSILESMACGTPVVAFDTGGVSEIIDHKVDGYIAKYKDEEDLEKGLQLILNSKEELKTSARTKMINKFDCDIIFNKYLELFLEK